MEWIHDEYSVVEKHAQTMLQLLEFGMDWETYGELEQIVNIPVTQIVEEITELHRKNHRVPDCGRDHRVENSSSTEEIAEVSKSSIEWRSIPNLYFEGIKVFLG